METQVDKFEYKTLQSRIDTSQNLMNQMSVEGWAFVYMSPITSRFGLFTFKREKQLQSLNSNAGSTPDR